MTKVSISSSFSFFCILAVTRIIEFALAAETLVKNSTCYNGNTNVNIVLNSNSLITVCFDSNQANTISTFHKINGSATFEISNARPSFKENVFYPTISADEGYSQSHQLSTVSSLVGSDSLGSTYIDPQRSLYFARGHLSPDGDFALVTEQNATYYYINVVPQWQIINNGNWKERPNEPNSQAMEIAIRNYAVNNRKNLNIWTGGLRVLRLLDVNMNQVEIYLESDSTGPKLPVPEVTWKVIQEPVGKKAVVIFMINNPHLTSIPQELLLCPDVCGMVPWITWTRADISKGYTFCCTWANAKAILPMVPNLGTVGLLI